MRYINNFINNLKILLILIGFGMLIAFAWLGILTWMNYFSGEGYLVSRHIDLITRILFLVSLFIGMFLIDHRKNN